MTVAAAVVFDTRSADPTGTAGLRRSFRAAGKLRMNMFRSGMRQAVVEHDVLGLGGAGLAMQPPETRLQAFNGWARVAAGRALDGPWLSEWIARAWASGEATGAAQTRSQAPGEGSGAWAELAKVELDAIAFAVVQVITREAAIALTKRRANKVMVWRRMAKAFDKVGPKRIMALANTFCVACHNRGRVAAYRAAGITQVGVVPERLLPKQALLLPGGLGDQSLVVHDDQHKGYSKLGPARSQADLPEAEGGIEVGVRTAGDIHVCQACDDFAAGSPYDIDEVEDTLPMHVACRCTWFPWDDKRFKRDAVPSKSEREETLERLMRRRHRALARMAPRRFRKPWRDDWDDEYNPNEPRDPDGKWTSAGGGSAGGDGHPGKGYSASARLIKGVIHTGSVYDAQRALFENRKVELKHIKEVSTLIDKLGETAAKMEAAGEKAPLFNLCNVSVTGTNLFCAESKGIPRVEMPVIRAKKTKEFVKYLKSRGYKVEKSVERADHLRSTQDEIDGVKVASNMARIDKEGFYKRIVVSRDDYILDGHHTWAGQLGVDARDGSLKGDKTVRIARVDISITKLLAEAETWTGGAGKKAAGQDAWNPNQPRDPSGKWTGGHEEGSAAAEHNAAHMASMSAERQAFHRAYGEVALRRGFKEIGTSIVPEMPDDYVHKMYRLGGPGGERLHFYPEHDQGIKWAHFAESGKQRAGFGGPEEVEAFLRKRDPDGGDYFRKNFHKAGRIGGYSVPTPEEAARYIRAYEEEGKRIARYARKPTGPNDAWNPDQPRAAPGVYSAHGGEFTSGGGGAGGGTATKKQGVKGPGAKPVWKPSSSTGQHRERVEQILKKPALRNSRFRYQVGKLMDEAKVYATTYQPGIDSINTSSALALMKGKIGESFWQQAVLKIKKAGGQTTETKKMIQQANAHGYYPPVEQANAMAALFSQVGSVTKVVKAKAQTPAEYTHTVLSKLTAAEKTAKAAAETPGNLTDPLAAELEKPAKPAATIPVATGKWTKLGPQKGSVSGGMYGDPQGTTWYVKTPKTEDHVNADMLANSLYKLAGVNVAHQVKTQLDGKPAVASLYVQNTDTLAGQSGEAKTNAQKMLREHFAVDAWLGNRDVVGLEQDNVLVSPSGITRIDFGASLMYRAQGDTKEFTDHVGEISSMRDPSINAQSAAVFGNMTDAEVSASINHVLSIPNSLIMSQVKAHGFPVSLAMTLIERKDFLANYKAIIMEGAPPAPILDPQIAATPPMQVGAASWETKLEQQKAAMAPKATAAELEKAKKVGPFYPNPTSPLGQSVVGGWNLKWGSTAATTPEMLEQKVQEYKAVKAELETVLKGEEAATHAAAQIAQAEQDKIIAKQNAEKAAKLKAEKSAAKAKEEAESAKHMAAIESIAAELGLSPSDADQVDTLISLAGGDKAAIVSKFKEFQKSGIGKHGLPITPFQSAMIQSYVGNAYINANEQLREGVWDMKTHVFAAGIQKGLSKLPGYNDTVKRGFNLIKQSDQAKYEVGKIIHWNAFSSCGKKSSFSGNMQCTITPLPGDNTRARDLGPMNPSEAGGEVLYMAHSTFKVTSVKGSPGGTMYVNLQEVETF